MSLAIRLMLINLLLYHWSIVHIVNPILTSPLGSYRTKYFRIHISHHLKNMITLHLYPILKQVKLDLLRWLSLTISWLGRIAVIKMNVLSRILYPIQMIPNIIPDSVFKDIHKTISKFICKNRQPKMRLQKLQLLVEGGGPAVPNFLYCHWSI